MRSWNYIKPDEVDRSVWNQTFIDLLDEVCNPYDNNEFDLIVPNKFENFFDFLSKFKEEIKNLYNIKFIDADIDYIIIEDIDIIKIVDYNSSYKFCFVEYKHYLGTTYNTIDNEGRTWTHENFSIEKMPILIEYKYIYDEYLTINNCEIPHEYGLVEYMADKVLKHKGFL